MHGWQPADGPRPKPPRTGSGVKPAPDRGDLAARIARLELKPGDTLVATLDRSIATAAVADALRSHIAAALPPGAKILVIDDRVQLSVVNAGAP